LCSRDDSCLDFARRILHLCPCDPPLQIITLNSVSIIVAEFIPFGANQIVQMNQNLGSSERVQARTAKSAPHIGPPLASCPNPRLGRHTLTPRLFALVPFEVGHTSVPCAMWACVLQGGFFTALIDNDSSGTKFEVQPGLTSISILDYTLTKHVNFEADIHLPEDEGVVQVETFGVSMNADGTVFYGMQVCVCAYVRGVCACAQVV
jgi:hypothetical protein